MTFKVKDGLRVGATDIVDSSGNWTGGVISLDKGGTGASYASTSALLAGIGAAALVGSTFSGNINVYKNGPAIHLRENANNNTGRLFVNSTAVYLEAGNTSTPSSTSVPLVFTNFDRGTEFARFVNTRFLIGTTTDDGTSKLQVNGNVAVTGALSTTGAATLGSTIIANANNPEAVRIKGGTADAAYMGFYPVAAEQAGRKAYMGFGSAASLLFTLRNEVGGLDLESSSTSAITVRTRGAAPIYLLTNNTERAQINSSGRMLLGTTTDDGSNRLQIGGGVAITLSYRGSGSNAGDYFTLQNTGAKTVLRSGNSTANSWLPIEFQHNNANPMYVFDQGVLTVKAYNHNAQFILDSAASTQPSYFRIRASSNGNVAIETSTNGTSGSAADLVFGNGLNAATHMVIKSTGRVLIGTTTDDGSSRLQVAGSTAITGDIILNAVAANTAAIKIRANAGTSSTEFEINQNGSNEVALMNRSAGPMKFGTGNTERMRLNSSGRLLIGTVTDNGNYRLQVSGGAEITSQGGTTLSLGESAGVEASLRIRGNGNANSAALKLAQDASNHGCIWNDTAAADIYVGIGSTEIMRFKSTGKAIIGGTTTLNSANLTVHGTFAVQPSPTFGTVAVMGAGSIGSMIRFHNADGSTVRAQVANNGGSNEILGLYATGYIGFNVKSTVGDNEQFRVIAGNQTAVNRVEVYGAATGTRPGIRANGSDADVSLDLMSKGTGHVRILSNHGTSGFEIARFVNGGRVLIGTTTDDSSNTLQVTGNTKLTGDLAVTGTVNATTLVAAGATSGVQINQRGSTATTAYLLYSSATAGQLQFWNGTRDAAFLAANGDFYLNGIVVTTDADTNNSPSYFLRGYYDSDVTTGVTSTSYDIGLQNIMTAGGASPAAKLSFSFAGTERASITSAGAFSASGTVSGTQLVSTVATGTAPFSVTSTTTVTNLSADKLDGFDSTDFVQTLTVSSSPPSSPTPGTRWVDSDTGTEYVFIDDGDSTQWVEMGVTAGGAVSRTGDANLAGNFAPIANNTYDFGTSSFKWANIHATTFHGVATSAQYGDVAERYAADGVIGPGDLVEIGGSHEIRLTTSDASIEVFGVISTAPAVRLNEGAGPDQTHPFVALSGRVPCWVVGSVTKGQRLVSSHIPGVARGWQPGDDSMAVFGRALEAKTITDPALIEIVVGVR